MTSAALRLAASNASSRSRLGPPVQAQTKSRIVRRGVISASATANDGRISTTGVSQRIIPASTSAAMNVVVIGFVTEATGIIVRGVNGSSPPSSLTPNPAV